MSEPALSLHRVTRRFGAVVAVRDASMQVVRGRIHALVGENGAGKSTLLGMAGGVIAPGSGSVLVDGRALQHAKPADASRRGVGFVHQHFMLVEAFTALENIVLGNEPTRSLGRLDLLAARTRAERVMGELDLHFELDAPVSELGVGERQSLEITRILVRGATIILLDEPTAVLTPGQAKRLYSVLRRMADNDAAVVVVTHRLAEVMNYCDEVSVMRHGAIVGHWEVSQLDDEQLTRAIMGREPPAPVQPPELPDSSRSALRLQALTVARPGADARALTDIALELKSGEIVGIAGVEGNGQHELVRSIAGLAQVQGGSIWLGDVDITRLSVHRRRELGLAVVHADRHLDGLLLEAPVADNLVLGDLGSGLDEAAVVARRMTQFDVSPPEPQLVVRSLSGGNQQKVVMARALDRRVRAVVLAQPTRGVDLGAAHAIHEAIVAAARAGAGVLVVSADLAELRALCHRILVLARGRIVASFPPDAPEEQFGNAMLGGQDVET